MILPDDDIVHTANLGRPQGRRVANQDGLLITSDYVSITQFFNLQQRTRTDIDAQNMWADTLNTCSKYFEKS